MEKHISAPLILALLLAGACYLKKQSSAQLRETPPMARHMAGFDI